MEELSAWEIQSKLHYSCSPFTFFISFCPILLFYLGLNKTDKYLQVDLKKTGLLVGVSHCAQLDFIKG